MMQPRSIAYIFFLLIAVLACEKQNPPAVTSPVTKPAEPEIVAKPEVVAKPLRDPADTVDTEQRIPGDFKGNYVWTAAMNLAWREVMDSILHGPAELAGLSVSGKQMLQKLNDSKFSKIDLDKESYYVKSGFGKETMDAIQHGVAAKFPDAQLQAKGYPMKPTYFMAYAALVKNVHYRLDFEPDTVMFQGKKVLGFSGTDVLMDNAEVVYYESNDKFIIRILLEEYEDELLLAKGFPMNQPDDALALVQQNRRKRSLCHFDDELRAPNLGLEFHRSFQPLLRHYFKNEGFTRHRIEILEEWMKFEMDFSGARLEASAEELAVDGIFGEGARDFFLDQPYWVIMKRRDSPRPYFILGVRNAAMMTPALASKQSGKR